MSMLVAKNISIIGVYFICCLNNYLDIVKEQMDILNKGLLNVTTKLIIFDLSCSKIL